MAEAAIVCSFKKRDLYIRTNSVLLCPPNAGMCADHDKFAAHFLRLRHLLVELATRRYSLSIQGVHVK